MFIKFCEKITNKFKSNLNSFKKIFKTQENKKN